MNVKCEKCGQTYEVEENMEGQNVECQCGKVFKVPTTSTQKVKIPPNKTGFTRPTIAAILDNVGLTLLALGIVGFIFGIIFAAMYNVSFVPFMIASFGAIVSSISWIAFGAIIKYLAEIAHNTRK